jgi:hypothetical protein
MNQLTVQYRRVRPQLDEVLRIKAHLGRRELRVRLRKSLAF